MLYLSPHNLSSSSPFDVPSPESFSSSSCWLSSIFYKNAFSLFTIDDSTLLSNAIPQQNPIHPRFLSFLQHDQTLHFHVHNTIIDPFIHCFPFPNQRLLPNVIYFMGGSSLHTTHVCSPHLSEIFHLYHLISLIPLYPSFISLYLVFHTLPLSLSRHMADIFLSTILPLPLTPSTSYIS